jgi:O-antigen/teichoic acid export membrane protein
MSEAVADLGASAALRTARLAVTVRLLTLPLTALAIAFSSRLVIGGYGVQQFATYALVVGLVALIPINDLGVGAALTDAVARRDTLGAQQLRAVTLSSFRILLLISLGVAATALVGGVLGLWSVVIGLAGNAEANRAATVALAAIALAPLPTASLRILQGLHANHIATALQAFAPVLTLAALFGLSHAGAPMWVLAASPGLGYTAAGLLGMWIVHRRRTLPVLSVLRSVPIRSQRGGRIRDFALPMLLIGLTLPIAYQTDRLVLSWVTNLDVVAQYSVAAPLLTAALTVMAAGGSSLWAVFAERRDHSNTTWSALTRLVAIFSAAGLALGVGLIGFGPAVAEFVGDGEVTTPIGVFVSFAALVLALAAWWPLAMYLTAPADLRRQAWWHGGMVVTNLAVSVPLAMWLGAAGPALASALCVVLWLLAPGTIRARRLSAT